MIQQRGEGELFGKGNALLHGLHPAGSKSAELFLEPPYQYLPTLSTLYLNLVIHFTDLNVKTFRISGGNEPEFSYLSMWKTLIDFACRNFMCPVQDKIPSFFYTILYMTCLT